MKNITVTIIQSDLYWENTGANLSMFEEKIWKIPGNTDLIVLPEMFTTGFTMNAASLAEPMNLTTFKWMKQQAAQTGAVVTGSFIVKEDTNFYNRLIWMQPDGVFYSYDKKHLFHPALENTVYKAGREKIILEWKGWKFSPLICYDLRFPVWSRNRWNGNSAEYDCLIYVANWPSARHFAWESLLKARAIENLSYTIGVNRIGNDEKNLQYFGGSVVLNFKGEELFNADSKEIMQSITLDKDALDDFREKFSFYTDADKFELI